MRWQIRRACRFGIRARRGPLDSGGSGDARLDLFGICGQHRRRVACRRRPRAGGGLHSRRDRDGGLSTARRSRTGQAVSRRLRSACRAHQSGGSLSIRGCADRPQRCSCGLAGRAVRCSRRRLCRTPRPTPIASSAGAQNPMPTPPPRRRNSMPKQGVRYPPRQAQFDDALELSLLPGLPEPVVERVLPFVTVFSGRPGIDVASADPAVLSALPGMTPQIVGAVLKARANDSRRQRGRFWRFLVRRGATPPRTDQRRSAPQSRLSSTTAAAFTRKSCFVSRTGATSLMIFFTGGTISMVRCNPYRRGR